MAWSPQGRHLPSNWTTIRRHVFQRDHWQCVDCGWHDPTGRTLECDHTGDPDDHRPPVLATRCRPCHRRRTQQQAAAARGAGPARRRPDEPHPGTLTPPDTPGGHPPTTPPPGPLTETFIQEAPVHHSVQAYVRHQVAALDLNRGHVVELGSLDVNGGVRQFFDQADSYVGIDLVDGPGVDQVGDAHATGLKARSVDTVVCCEMLEHDEDPVATVKEAARLLKPGGHLILTARSEGFPRHHEPDLWRFTHDDIAALAFTAKLELVDQTDDPQAGHPGVFAVLRKPASKPKPRARKAN